DSHEGNHNRNLNKLSCQKAGCLLVLWNYRIVESGTAMPIAAFQFGNGSRLDLRKLSISSRTRQRRQRRCSTSCSKSSLVEPYHSGGTTSAIDQSCCASMFSIRESQGSND